MTDLLPVIRSTNEALMHTTNALLCIIVLILSVSAIKVNSKLHRIDRRLEFVMSVIEDYDRPIQFRKYLDGEENHSHDIRYGDNNIWKDIK